MSDACCVTVITKASQTFMYSLLDVMLTCLYRLLSDMIPYYAHGYGLSLGG